MERNGRCRKSRRENILETKNYATWISQTSNRAGVLERSGNGGAVGTEMLLFHPSCC